MGHKTWSSSLIGQVHCGAWRLGASLGARLAFPATFQSTTIATAVLDRLLPSTILSAVVFASPDWTAKMLVSLTVGKVDAGVAVLLTQDNRLVGHRPGERWRDICK